MCLLTMSRDSDNSGSGPLRRPGPPLQTSDPKHVPVHVGPTTTSTVTAQPLLVAGSSTSVPPLALLALPVDSASVGDRPGVLSIGGATVTDAGSTAFDDLFTVDFTNVDQDSGFNFNPELAIGPEPEAPSNLFLRPYDDI